MSVEKDPQGEAIPVVPRLVQMLYRGVKTVDEMDELVDETLFQTSLGAVPINAANLFLRGVEAKISLQKLAIRSEMLVSRVPEPRQRKTLPAPINGKRKAS